MPAPTQTGRHMILTTPLGVDKLLFTNLHAREGISELFHYSVDAIVAAGTDVPFDKLIGQSVTIKYEYPGKSVIRYFNGICNAVSQGESDVEWTTYRLEIVPKLWLLTKRTDTRTFQQMTIPDILKKVLAGFDVTYELQGTFQPRDYVVQYRETDFNFVSRIMEEEGIFYFFKHADGAHQLVVSNTPTYPPVPFKDAITYKNVNFTQAQAEDFIFDWGKKQELRSGRVSLWDHCFETPGRNYESIKPTADAVQVGGVSHKLKLPVSEQLEQYDYPGEFAQRFDGVAPGGGDRAGDIGKIQPDGTRTVQLRMEGEAAEAVVAHGSSTCGQLSAGHKFNLKSGDALSKAIKPDGAYVVRSVTHTASVQDMYRAGSGDSFTYSNVFQAVPAAWPWRPPRTAVKPVVPGCQTATVVGPPGEEIFTDKYGRVKVQFHWDRIGKKNADSSCWIRCGTNSAGRGWGIYSIPRIGQEVIVDFLEGDPDQPIIVGMVWNAGQMPAYTLPDEKTKSYIKTNSSMGGVGYNEIRFEDKKSSEQIFIHAEKNQDIRVKNDHMEHVMHDRHMKVGDTKDGKKVGNQNEEVMVDKNLKVHKNLTEHIGGNMKLLVGGIDKGEGNVDIHYKKDLKELIDGNVDVQILKHLLVMIGEKIGVTMQQDVHTRIEGKQEAEVVKDQINQIGGSQSNSVGGNQATSVGGKQDLKVGGDQTTEIVGKVSLKAGSDMDVKVGPKYALESAAEVHIKSGGKVIIEAMQVSLKGPGGFVDVGPTGVTIQGTMVLINSGGAAGSGSGVSVKTPAKPAGIQQPPEKPQKPADAAPVAPTAADDSKSGAKSCD